MTARADAVAATRDRILDAVVAIYVEREFHDVPLEQVAGRAGTTVQTILRHFGSKDAVVGAAVRRQAGRIAAEREELPAGDVGATVAYLSCHYEEMGDQVLRLLADERRLPAAAEIVAEGRRIHRDWVARSFAAWLDGLEPAARRRGHAVLVATTDVYTWKLLRRDSGLGRDQYELAVGELLHAITGGP